MNYCHNCRHWSHLADSAHCAWCLTFWYANARMPTPTDSSLPFITVMNANRTERPAMNRPIRITQEARDNLTARKTHPTEPNGASEMEFTDRDGKRWTDVVICARCGFTSRDLALARCPNDGATLGETSVEVSS